MERRTLLGTVVASLASLRAAKLEHDDGRELLGRPAPPLELDGWLGSRKLEMTGLRGKVVLLRWWTSGCELCDATAPALRKLQRGYESQGLQIIGVYHPKPPGSIDIGVVEREARQKQFTFPIALDTHWSALRRWWLDRERDYTSVSFLVDRRGNIRYVHAGGEFHEGGEGAFEHHDRCNRDFRAIDAEIARLLRE
jgi:thiol-disulfide isomerase/thioredoxin